MTMTRRLLTFLPLLVACSAATSSRPVVEEEQRLDKKGLLSMTGQAIVCYNVENLFDTVDDPATNDEDFLPDGALAWTADRYDHKLLHLSEAIAWCADGPPALLGLVEVENRSVLDDLATTGRLKEADYAIVHHDSPDERGIDVALLVHPQYAAVVHDEALTVAIPNDRTRDVLHVELGLHDGQRMHVFVNHWPSRRDGDASVPKRMTAAGVVRSRVDRILATDPTARILIMGDFNDTPMNASISEGLGAACDRNTEAVLYDLMCIDQPNGHGSYNYQGEWDYLDQMIVSAALIPMVASAKAYWDDRLLFKHPRYGRSPDRTYAGRDYKGGYSDHLPIVLRLK